MTSTAPDQWARYLAGYSPGIRYSDLPRHFVVPVGDGRTLSVDLRGAEFDKNKWTTISEYIQYVIQQFHPSWKIPQGWSYEDLAKDITPNPLDLPNPRIYTLDGQILPWPLELDELHGVLLEHFAKHLEKKFRDTPPNGQDRFVKDFLTYHHDNGGLPDHFTKFVEKMLMHWESSTVPDGLKAEVRVWREERRRGQVNLTNTKRPAPSVRTIAERLEAALPGARQAFDEMLLMDGFTNKAGEYVGPKRKGKAGIIANWDAVVEAFRVEGYPEHGGELAVALGDYIPGLKIDKRTSRMREGQPYRLKLKHAKAYVKSKAEHSR